MPISLAPSNGWWEPGRSSVTGPPRGEHMRHRDWCESWGPSSRSWSRDSCAGRRRPRRWVLQPQMPLVELRPIRSSSRPTSGAGTDATGLGLLGVRHAGQGWGPPRPTSPTAAAGSAPRRSRPGPPIPHPQRMWTPTAVLDRQGQTPISSGTSRPVACTAGRAIVAQRRIASAPSRPGRPSGSSRTADGQEKALVPVDYDGRLACGPFITDTGDGGIGEGIYAPRRRSCAITISAWSEVPQQLGRRDHRERPSQVGSRGYRWEARPRASLKSSSQLGHGVIATLARPARTAMSPSSSWAQTCVPVTEPRDHWPGQGDNPSGLNDAAVDRVRRSPDPDQVPRHEASA